MWSHDVVSTSIGLASDLKLGQYPKGWVVFLDAGPQCSWCPGKIPPRAMFLSQIWGTIIGKSQNQCCRCMEILTLSIITGRMHCELLVWYIHGEYRGRLTLCSGANGLFITWLSWSPLPDHSAKSYSSLRETTSGAGSRFSRLTATLLLGLLQSSCTDRQGVTSSCHSAFSLVSQRHSCIG